MNFAVEDLIRVRTEPPIPWIQRDDVTSFTHEFRARSTAKAA